MQIKQHLKSIILIIIVFLTTIFSFSQKNKTGGIYNKMLLVFLYFLIPFSVISQNQTNYKIAVELNKKGDSIFDNSNYDKAVIKYLQSYELIKNSDSVFFISDVLNNIGVSYDYLGQYENAIRYYNKALVLNQTYNNKKGLAVTFNNLGALYFFWKKLDLALDYYLKSLKIEIELNDLKGKCGSYENIAIIYKNKKRYKLANDYFKKSLEISTILNDEKAIGTTYCNKGNMYLEQNLFKDAIYSYKKSLVLAIKNNDIEGEVYNYNNLGKVYFELKQFSKSEEYYLKALKIAESKKLKIEILYSLNSLSELYSKNKQYKKANEYLGNYYRLKDTIFTETKHQQMMNLEKKYESEQKNKEIELLNLKAEKQINEITTKRKERNLWFGISILAILIGGVSIYFFLNKKKLSEELSAKNLVIQKTLSEKDILLREIHHRVKNNLQIISSLLNMQSRYLSDDKSKEIVNESKNRIKSMSLIHQKLYQEENLTGIETKTYFEELIDSLIMSYGINTEKIKTSITIENLLLDVDTAIPLGLILNEIISNAFKYGVNKETGKFDFIFKQTSDDELFFSVKDNGPGIPESFDITKSKSYGMKLIKSLSKKLKANLEYKNNNGLEITMKIHKFKVSKTTQK